MNYTPRLLEPRCLQVLEAGKILVLLGPRQAGKTTLARRILRGVPENLRLYLNMDDVFLRDSLASTPNALQRSVEERTGTPLDDMPQPFHLVIDEAQKAPALFEMVKALTERYPDQLRVILTGSSVLSLHDPVAESLAGRVRIVPLLPFTMAEAFAHTTRASLDAGLEPLMSALLAGQFEPGHFDLLVKRCRYQMAQKAEFLSKAIRFPLFPEPCGLSEPEEWIRDYLATYIEKDIQSLSSVGSVALFRQCLRQLAAHAGSPVKWETMAQQVGTTSVTLKKYAGLMEQTLNLIRLSPFAANPVVRVVRAPKLYPADPGLMWGLRGYEDRRLLEATGMMGVYMELAAIAEIAKWCALQPTSPELRYWSKTAVSEVDLVVSNRGYHIPFEIKLSSSFDHSWLRGLNAFDSDHKNLNLQIPYRVIIYSGDPLQIDSRTYAIPLWGLM